MVVLKRRSRIVSFRLSEEEYRSMMETCVNQGARSLSDYARMAACRQAAVNGIQNGAQVELAVDHLRVRVEELETLVRRLASKN